MINKSIVLLSGGMDSLVTAAIAAKESDEVYFLHINYRQKTQERELKSFSQISDFYKPKNTLIIDIDYLAKIGGSSLTDKGMRVKDYVEANDVVPDSYVPFRNGNLLAIATSWGEVIGANRIYLGAVEEDSSGYPDCRESFYTAYQKTIDMGTKDETKIKIITPIIHMKKSKIIAMGNKLGTPFEYSWSCYKENEEACGVCDSCHLRINAFKEAGLKDPIPYKIKIDWGK